MSLQGKIKMLSPITGWADKNGMILSRYLLNAGIAGLESKQNRK